MDTKSNSQLRTSYWSRVGFQYPPHLSFHLLAFHLAVALTIVIPWVYVAHEHYFYYWDLANFHDMAVAKSLAIRESFSEALLDVGRSVKRNYNEIFTIPLVPFILLFGDSRLVYIVSLAVIYLLPFAMVMGALAVLLVPLKKSAAFWSAVAITLFMPTVWASLLLGWPDSGAALLIALASWIYLRNIRFNRWHQLFSVGVLIAMAMLFRRHFAYSGTALLASIGLHGLVNMHAHWQSVENARFVEFLNLTKRLALTACISLLTLAVVAPKFLSYLVTRDYGVHASYVRSASDNFQYIGSQFGWLLWLLVIIGLVGGMRTSVIARPVATFLVIFGSLSLFQWPFNVGQLGTQYMLHFAPVVVLGLVSCLCMASCHLKNFWREAAIISMVLLLMVNVTQALSKFDILNLNFSGGWLSARYPPKVRADYDEIGRLVIYLRELTHSDERIYVGASSYELNWDILRHAERELFGLDKSKLNIPYTPEVDSRDSYEMAVNALLRAQYVLVAEPFQYHLRPEEQKVVGKVVAAFGENWEISRDFILLPQKFALANGAAIKIYKRIQPTEPETARRTLGAMEKAPPLVSG